MNASSLYSRRSIGEYTAQVADDVKCNQFSQQPSSWSGTNAKILPSFRIVDAQSNADNLVLEIFLSVSDTAQILGSRRRQRWPRAVAAAAGAAVLRRAARAVTGGTDTRGDVKYAI